MRARARAIAGGQRHVRQAELGGAEADHVVVLGEPVTALLGGGPGACLIARASVQHRQAPERDPDAAPVADLLAESEAAAEQLPAALEVATGAGEVAECAQREGFPLHVGESLKAREALFDQFTRPVEVAVHPIDDSEVAQDVGNRRFATDPATENVFVMAACLLRRAARRPALRG